jgi:Na+-transporting methylmalonyl-CoA/oxaloacetate decarboxylase gamma subunit
VKVTISMMRLGGMRVVLAVVLVLAVLVMMVRVMVRRRCQPLVGQKTRKGYRRAAQARHQVED